MRTLHACGAHGIICCARCVSGVPEQHYRQMSRANDAADPRDDPGFGFKEHSEDADVEVLRSLLRRKKKKKRAAADAGLRARADSSLADARDYNAAFPSARARDAMRVAGATGDLERLQAAAAEYQRLC